MTRKGREFYLLVLLGRLAKFSRDILRWTPAFRLSFRAALQPAHAAHGSRTYMCVSIYSGQIFAGCIPEYIAGTYSSLSCALCIGGACMDNLMSLYSGNKNGCRNCSSVFSSCCCFFKPIYQSIHQDIYDVWV